MRAGDWISVVAPEKSSRDSEWNRIVCCGDCVRFAWCEELQALFGSECSKGGRQAPRCAILVRESEHGRDVQSFNNSVRDERHEPRCVLPLLLRWYRGVVRTTRDELGSHGVFEMPDEIVPHNARTTGKNGNSGLVSSLSELEQIEDMTITIAKSGSVEDSELCRKSAVKVSRR